MRRYFAAYLPKQRLNKKLDPREPLFNGHLGLSTFPADRCLKSYPTRLEANMKGVVFTPILAAIFAMMITRSGAVAAGAFFAVIAVELVVMATMVKRRKPNA